MELLRNRYRIYWRRRGWRVGCVAYIHENDPAKAVLRLRTIVGDANVEHVEGVVLAPEKPLADYAR